MTGVSTREGIVISAYHFSSEVERERDVTTVSEEKKTIIGRPFIELRGDREGAMFLPSEERFRKEFVRQSFSLDLALKFSVNYFDENRIREKNDVFIVSVIGDVIRSSGKGIRLDHSRAWGMQELQVEFG